VSSKSDHNHNTAFATMLTQNVILYLAALFLLAIDQIAAIEQLQGTPSNLHSRWFEPAKTTRVYLVCKEKLMMVDGTRKIRWTFNGTVPGPLIQVTEGDRLIATIKNDCPAPITVHWHGMFQTKTPQMDGVPFVTQVPIPKGQTWVYNFTVQNLHGSAWYHSHQGLQYMDGLFGPLIVNPRKRLDKREVMEERILQFSDFYHNQTAQLTSWFLSPASQGNEPVPDAGLVNGKGRFNCSLTDKPCETQPFQRIKVEAGKRYLFRIISSATLSAFRFSIDDHELQVVGVDLTPIHPVAVDVMSINVGQRVNVIVTAKKGAKNAWIRFTMETACYAYVNPVLNPNVKVILDYGSNSLPTTKPNEEQMSQACRLLDYTNLVPLKPTRIPMFANGDVLHKVDFVFRNNKQDVNLAYINGHSYVAPRVPTQTMVVKYPSLKYQNGSSIFAPTQNVFVLPDAEGNGYWAWLAVNNFDNGEHPWHLHGTTPCILGQGRKGPFDMKRDMSKLNLKNPLCRDTFTVPYGLNSPAGWTVIAWKVTPRTYIGCFVFHCHIEWHIQAGLLAQFVSQSQAISNLLQ
jgi:FtsP/CotA-like multicopper oxidase with cupredoxin domain